jgi:tetratricopeptide (TPR) repeat protein
MRRFFIFLALSLSTLLAQDIKEIFTAQGGKLTPELQKLLKDDQHYFMAVKYLTDEEYMAKTTVLVGDPEDKINKPIEKEQAIPEYNKALKELKKSVQRYDNQVSAFYGLYIIKSFFGKSTKLQEFRDFSKLLYEKEKEICEAYIDYGETLEKGYYTRVDKQKALEVYKEAEKIEKCMQGWYASVIGAKIYNLEK